MHRVLLFLATLLFLLSSPPNRAQQPHPAPTETPQQYVQVLANHISWPSPQVVANDLLSSDDDVRAHGLNLLGFSSTQIHKSVWSRESTSSTNSEKVITPDQVHLIYAALGEDATRQAILSIEVQELQVTFVAVAAPSAEGWQRIAAIDCWCKYDMVEGRSALTEFLQLQPAPEREPTVPQHFELVVHASGGGIGLYTQTEIRFRLHGGELRRVLSFTSRRRSCDPTGASPHRCTLEKRWFYPTQVADRPGGVLVEGRARFPSDDQPPIFWQVTQLEDRQLQHFQCVDFKWSDQLFRYEKVGTVPDPCMAPK